VEKPQYRVLSLKEIKELKKSYKVVSTFSGCGGSSLGYRMAGLNVIWANEFIPKAQKAYLENKEAGCFLNLKDIRQVRPEDILEEAMVKKGEIDIFDGSPPCSSFSTAGKRERGWGKVKKYSNTTQRTDDLFFEYIRLIRGTEPKVFIAENVSGLIKGAAKGYFLKILEELKKSGYRVKCALLDAKFLGVPQSRQRTIFIGVRQDIKAEPVFPKPLNYFYTLGDILYNIDKSNNKIEKETDITKYCTGREWDKLGIGEQSEKYFNLVRPALNRPCPTICASHGSQGIASVTHPFEKRKFSIYELKKICGFPDDFILSGTYEENWERLGRSVPPVMMKYIATQVKNRILDKI
jgi:DNA (cytosine-5)-methyltransferase 1